MTSSRQDVLRALRPPTLKATQVVFPFQRNEPKNLGLTLGVNAGDALVAPGDGVVDLAQSGTPGWRFRDAATGRSKAVRIDHGFGVKSYVHGLQPSVVKGSRVTRGQQIGTAVGTEVWFAVELSRSMLNPSAVNDYFAPRDGTIFPGQAGYIRQAPTVIKQTATTIRSAVEAGVRYFFSGTAQPILFNVAFNGSGAKSGLAVVGYEDTDYWNVYDPVEFIVTGTACDYSYGGGSYIGSYYNSSPMAQLKDYREENAKVFLERIAPLSVYAGTAVSWDDLLASWIGGYAGMVPYVNVFKLRGLPRGSYDIYLYADQGTYPDSSYFQVDVDGATQTGNTSPSGASSWIEDDNFVKFSLSLGARSVVEITATGYLSGLQIIRT